MKSDRIRGLRVAAVALSATALIAACGPPAPAGFQGYVEGEFVNVAASLAGRLDGWRSSAATRSPRGARLYVLEAASDEAAERAGAPSRSRGAGATRRPEARSRPPEQAVTRAQIAQAQVEERRSATQLARDEAQFAAWRHRPQAQLDDSARRCAVNAARVAQLQSELAVAQLPSRGEQIKAQAAQVAAARAALAQASWRLGAEVGAATRAGTRHRHAVPRRRVGAGREPGGAHAAAAEREGALLRARDRGRQPGAGRAVGDPLRRLRRRRSRRR